MGYTPRAANKYQCFGSLRKRTYGVKTPYRLAKLDPGRARMISEAERHEPEALKIILAD
jgi:hypothetical protein